MPLQTQNLVMIGLGVQGDSPPNGVQPPLVDGVHLRWAFKRDLGFPWYGFYLFRRPHQPGKLICLSPTLQALAAGPMGSNLLTTPMGEVSSDQNLVLTNNFPPSGAPELDLAGRRYLRLTLPAGEVAYRAEVRVGFRPGQASHARQPTITVTALLGEQPVGRVVVSGQPGQTATANLAFDAISAIELTSGPAALIDLCYVPVSQNAAAGWAVIPEFSYPLCLPLTHPDYPCSGNQPVNEGAAEARALARVVYGPPAPWAGTPFADLHQQLVRLVVGGPGGVPMASRTLPAITAVPVPPDPDVQAPQIPSLAVLDLVLLSSLHPAMAQLLGLYWVDRKAPPGVAFDYLIVADYAGRGGREPTRLLAWLQKNGFADIDGYIVFNLKREKAVPLAPPCDPRAYALPGSTRAVKGGGLEDATNNAGLRWDLGVNLGVLQPGHAIMYHVWRAGLGDGDTPAPPGPYGLLTKEGAVLVAEPHIPPGASPERAGDWPPFPLHYVDPRLREGWYGYQVSGIDIFGRHSPNSAAAVWYEWAPVPDPRPWYYQDPPADRVIHPSAVRLLDKVPPPPPTGVEAYALDPADPTVVKDASYDAWWSSLSPAEQSGVTGLRVRWQWTDAHERQAPDTREFRVYYDPGRPNALIGHIASVTAAGAAESDVATDIVGTYPADACLGAWLRIAGHSFPVIGSQVGSPLRLRVRNLGLTYTTGTVAVATGSAVVVGTGTWNAGMTGKSLQVAGDAAVYAILSVQSPTQLTLSRPYTGSPGTGQSYTIFDLRPSAGAPCTVVIPATYGAGTVALTPNAPTVHGTGSGWNANLVGQTFRAEGHLGRYLILAVNSPTELVLDRNYAGPSGTGIPYTISHPLFTDYSAATNWDERYYVVGFDEHVTVGADAAGRSLRLYEVLLPAPGDAFRGGVPLATSPAEPIMYAQVGVSAADDKLHTADDPKWAAGRWGGRPGNEGPVGPPATIFRVQREPPSAPVPPPDAERVFATPADYHSRSYYTYRWRPAAHLKMHVFRALDDAVFKADWAQRPRPALDASQLQFFPDEATEPRWNAAKRQEVADELNQLNGFAHDADGTAQAIAYYQGLSNDGLRVLAGLPGNERAFTQLTIQPLDPDDPANANRRGPDNPPDFVVDPALRAYVDALDGRATSRYFYRSAYVDGAHNRGALSGASPPIWLPKVTPPRAPTLIRVSGGERQITLEWSLNREPDLAEYRIYRADNVSSARDLRLMTLVQTVPVPAGDPADRPPIVSWTDAPAPGLVTFQYRLVAVDDVGNTSEPSPPQSGRAHDQALPVVPTPIIAWVEQAGRVRAELAWTSEHEVLVQRREAEGGPWVDLISWRTPGSITIRDPFSDPTSSYQYRLWARKYTGAVVRGAPVPLEAQ